MSTAFPDALERFRVDYAEHRASEGRAHDADDLLSLPYLAAGPLARQWAVRASSFEALLARVVEPLWRRLDRPLDVLDLGAGNGWLSFRLALCGHNCTAIDIRDDEVDGLGAATPLQELAAFDCRLASFDALPLADQSADLAVFNAALHYATDLAATLAETARCVRPGGCIAIVDSPFYRTADAGEAMVHEKHADAAARFGDRAGSLLALGHVEFLTRDRLAGAAPALDWRRHRVLYPLWYELRPLVARLKGARPPSRFDIWVARIP